MAIYIPIKIIDENHYEAVYSFFGSGEVLIGKVKILKESGDVSLLWIKDAKYLFEYKRVKRKLFLHWRLGELPQSTNWAS